MPILSTQQVNKHFDSGGDLIHILKDVSFHLEAGRSCAIVGPSGSGKTTLLGLCAGLDTPSSGTVTLDGRELETLSEDGRAALRRERVGFIFQNFQLIPSLTALENVLVPLELLGRSASREQARALLAKVGLEDRGHHYPLQLSGGEQQRIAIARAFIHQPAILFADEPTGNLDVQTSSRVVEMMFQLNQEAGTAILMVTHDRGLAREADEMRTMDAGTLSEPNQSPNHA